MVFSQNKVRFFKVIADSGISMPWILIIYRKFFSLQRASSFKSRQVMVSSQIMGNSTI